MTDMGRKMERDRYEAGTAGVTLVSAKVKVHWLATKTSRLMYL